jgi:hypothetical protein
VQKDCTVGLEVCIVKEKYKFFKDEENKKIQQRN